VVQQQKPSIQNVQAELTTAAATSIVGSVASVASLITQYLWGSESIAEARFPGEAIIPMSILSRRPENKYEMFDLGWFYGGYLENLDINMRAYIEYTGTDPITVNMGIRFLEEESNRPLGWDVNSRVTKQADENDSIDIPGQNLTLMMRKRRITYRTTVDENGPGHWISDREIVLDPYAGLAFRDINIRGRLNNFTSSRPTKVDI
jgi:hypothetical protein